MWGIGKGVVKVEVVKGFLCLKYNISYDLWFFLRSMNLVIIKRNIKMKFGMIYWGVIFFGFILVIYIEVIVVIVNDNGCI